MRVPRLTLRSLLLLPVCLAALGLPTGCTTGKSDKWKFAQSWPTPWTSEKPEPPQLPDRMVTSWAHTVLHRAGESPKRGFGGRLLFFGNNSDQPVRVAGKLVIYAYDETDESPYNTQPTRRYIYPAEQFARLESANKLGPAYSVWLPWDEVGGPQKKISLIARFEPEGGHLILGEQTHHLLPGATMSTPLPPTNSIQLASHEAPITAEPDQGPRAASPQKSERGAFRTTSIPVPQRR